MKTVFYFASCLTAENSIILFGWSLRLCLVFCDFSIRLILFLFLILSTLTLLTCYHLCAFSYLSFPLSPSPSALPPAELRKTDNAYVRTSHIVEGEEKNLRQFTSLLNKLTWERFDSGMCEWRLLLASPPSLTCGVNGHSCSPTKWTNSEDEPCISF